MPVDRVHLRDRVDGSEAAAAGGADDRAPVPDAGGNGLAGRRIGWMVNHERTWVQWMADAGEPLTLRIG